MAAAGGGDHGVRRCRCRGRRGGRGACRAPQSPACTTRPSAGRAQLAASAAAPVEGGSGRGPHGRATRASREGSGVGDRRCEARASPSASAAGSERAGWGQARRAAWRAGPGLAWDDAGAARGRARARALSGGPAVARRAAAAAADGLTGASLRLVALALGMAVPPLLSACCSTHCTMFSYVLRGQARGRAWTQRRNGAAVEGPWARRVGERAGTPRPGKVGDLAVLAEEQERGVPLDVEAARQPLVLGRVYLSNVHASILLVKVVGHLLVGGRELLAVATPRSVCTIAAHGGGVSTRRPRKGGG